MDGNELTNRINSAFVAASHSATNLMRLANQRFPQDMPALLRKDAQTKLIWAQESLQKALRDVEAAYQILE